MLGRDGEPAPPAESRDAVKDFLARLCFGRRAHGALAAARRDLTSGSLTDAVARRTAMPLGRKARWRLRGVARALRAQLAAEGELRPCLPHALALFALARERGYEATLVLGVAKDGPAAALTSHAWLERDGRPFFEASATPTSYATIARFPAPPPARAGDV